MKWATGGVGHVLHVGRSRRGHQAEEDEDEDLAQSEVAVRMLPARVRPTGQAAEQADRDEPPGDADGQHEAGHGRDSERHERGDLHLSDRGQLPRHKTNRADPHLIGPPHAVGVVVDVVGPDLQPECHDQGQHGVEEREVMGHAHAGPMARVRTRSCRKEPGDEVPGHHVARRRTDDDRNHGRRQRPGARASHPQPPRGCHGRRGNLEKSGSRCSTNALRPS